MKTQGLWFERIERSKYTSLPTTLIPPVHFHPANPNRETHSACSLDRVDCIVLSHSSELLTGNPRSCIHRRPLHGYG